MSVTVMVRRKEIGENAMRRRRKTGSGRGIIHIRGRKTEKIVLKFS